MKAIEIRNKYLKFFEKNKHAVIPSAPLIPENDPTVLFNTAGMQPLVPYLLGKEHPKGNRIVSFQKCFRTVDIDEVGDNRHLTFFEMLGNWSLGDYFKEESIKMSFEFLTKELNIPVEKLSVTCFMGDSDAPKDNLSAECWEKEGIPKERIYFFGKDDNWWIAGETGPCGPDTEIFYDTGKKECSKECNPSCGCGKYVEIWNNVFMEYYKDEKGYTKLKQKNVDTGLGLERMVKILQDTDTPFETELFSTTMKKLEELQLVDNIQSRRIIAEHLRSSIMLTNDGARPSNVDRGYILRRLIRRMTRHLNKLGIDLNELSSLIQITLSNLKEMYPEVLENTKAIEQVILEEKDKFIRTLQNGEREFEKIVSRIKASNQTKIDTNIVFNLYETYGFPPEMTVELAKEQDLEVNIADFEKFFKEHQDKSRLGSDAKFKGGLADQNEKTVMYHTATHLLHKALQMVLGEHAVQKGSNITEERLRFDFAHPQKVTEEELKQVESIVNEQIKKGLDVTFEEMTLEEAKKSGAIGLFESKYGDKIKVYTIGDFSKEMCGGPHITNTEKMGTFKIKKEEASSAGVRRIKAVLE